MVWTKTRELIVEVPLTLYEERLVEAPQVQIFDCIRQVPVQQIQEVLKHIAKVDVPQVCVHEVAKRVPATSQGDDMGGSSSRTRSCSHGLTPFNAPHSGFRCDKCRERFPKGSKLFGCRSCNIDLCGPCESLRLGYANADGRRYDPDTGINDDGDPVQRGGSSGTGGFTDSEPSTLWYCGKQKNECQCGHCDGQCGPTNGCPCNVCYSHSTRQVCCVRFDVLCGMSLLLLSPSLFAYLNCCWVGKDRR